MIIFAIDPGPQLSAYVKYDADSKTIYGHGIIENGDMLGLIEKLPNCQHIAIEMIASMGMAVGQTVFETCVWIGRFTQAADGEVSRIYRSEVKMYLCGNMRAKDPNIRQALLDKFGPDREAAIGKKKTPGPLYGISKHEWAALAVAVTYAEDPLQIAKR